MKTLLILLLLLIAGCASPKQIATCVQACESINASVEGYTERNGDNAIYCTCVRIYKIDETGTNTQEVPR